jgi:hypothetical protein
MTEKLGSNVLQKPKTEKNLKPQESSYEPRLAKDLSTLIVLSRRATSSNSQETQKIVEIQNMCAGIEHSNPKPREKQLISQIKRLGNELLAANS